MGRPATEVQQAIYGFVLQQAQKANHDPPKYRDHRQLRNLAQPDRIARQIWGGVEWLMEPCVC